jgi:uncharacterized RDD family membrane protein YckC
MRQRRRPARKPGTKLPTSQSTATGKRQPASLARRLAALTYDWVLLTGVLFGATVAILAFRVGQAFPPHHPGYSAYLIATGAVFFGWFWTHGGQTLGMRAWKIELITVDGRPLTWRVALLRCVFALLGAALFGLGYLWMLVDPGRRCWQDIASGSRVVSCHDPDTKNGA